MLGSQQRWTKNGRHQPRRSWCPRRPDGSERRAPPRGKRGLQDRLVTPAEARSRFRTIIPFRLLLATAEQSDGLLADGASHVITSRRRSRRAYFQDDGELTRRRTTMDLVLALRWYRQVTMSGWEPEQDEDAVAPDDVVRRMAAASAQAQAAGLRRLVGDPAPQRIVGGLSASSNVATPSAEDHADSLLRDVLGLPDQDRAFLRSLAADLERVAWFLQPDADPTPPRRRPGHPFEPFGHLVQQLRHAFNALGLRDPVEAVALLLIAAEVRKPDEKDDGRLLANLDRLIRTVERSLSRAT
jgi:hypothetical protein